MTWPKLECIVEGLKGKYGHWNGFWKKTHLRPFQFQPQDFLFLFCLSVGNKMLENFKLGYGLVSTLNNATKNKRHLLRPL